MLHTPIKPLLLVALCYIVTALRTLAAPGEIGDDFTIGSTVGSGPARPSVGIDGAGSTTTVWRKLPESGNAQIVFRRFDRDRNPIGVETTVATGTGLFLPKVTVHEDGRFVIAYSQLVNLLSSTTKLHFYTADGSPTGISSFTGTTFHDIDHRDDGVTQILHRTNGEWKTSGLRADRSLAFEKTLLITIATGWQPKLACGRDGAYAIAWKTASSTNVSLGDTDVPIAFDNFAIPNADYVDLDLVALPHQGFAIAGLTTHPENELHLRTVDATASSDAQFFHTQKLYERGTHISLAISGKGDFLLGWTEENRLSTIDEPIAWAQRFFRGAIPADERIYLKFSRDTTHPDVALNQNGIGFLAHDTKALTLFFPPNPPPPASRTIHGQFFSTLPDPGAKRFIPITDTLTAPPALYKRIAHQGHPDGTRKATVYSIPQAPSSSTHNLQLAFGASTSTITTLSGDYPFKIAMPLPDIAMVAWATAGGIYLQEYVIDPTTSLASSSRNPTQVSSIAPGLALLDIATDGKGTTLIAYAEEDTNTINYRSFTSPALPIIIAPPPAIIETIGTRQFKAIAIDMNASRQFVIAYIDQDTPGNQSVRSKRYDTTGTPIGGDTRIDFNEVRLQGFPPSSLDVALHDNGNSLFLWDKWLITEDATGLHNAIGQLVSPTNTRIGHNFCYRTFYEKNYNYPILAATRQNGFVMFDREGLKLTAYHPSSGIPLNGSCHVTSPQPDPTLRHAAALTETIGGRISVAWIPGISATTTTKPYHTRDFRFAPYTLDIQPQGSGTYRITAPVLPGKSAYLQSSADLTTWSTSTILLPIAGNQYQHNISTTSSDRRFFRFLFR